MVQGYTPEATLLVLQGQLTGRAPVTLCHRMPTVLWGCRKPVQSSGLLNLARRQSGMLPRAVQHGQNNDSLFVTHHFYCQHCTACCTVKMAGCSVRVSISGHVTYTLDGDCRPLAFRTIIARYAYQASLRQQPILVEQSLCCCSCWHARLRLFGRLFMHAWTDFLHICKTCG